MGQSFRITAASVVFGITLGSLAALAAESRVVQTGKAFEPKALTVKAGDTVTFVNEDFYDHNVYSESTGNVFNLGIQPPGQTNGVTLATAGIVDVRCRINPKMKLVVTVE